MVPLLVRLAGVDRIFGSPELPVEALQDINIEIAGGEYVAIMGPSGSGKSTLLNVLGLLDRPSSGVYELGSIDTNSLDDSQRCHLRAHQIGFVFQSFHLIPHLTARENVLLGTVYNETPKNDRAPLAAAALHRVQLDHRTDFYPTTLSGGERQRVAIARALVGNPSVLLCDEPTGNLDTETGDGVLDAFELLRAETGITIIVVTHDPDVGRRADRTVRLRDGRMAA